MYLIVKSKSKQQYDCNLFLFNFTHLSFSAGSRLGTDKQDVSVLIGDTPCVVSTVSETSLTCDAGHPKSGLNSFSLTRISMGQARSSVTEVRVKNFHIFQDYY